MLSICWATTTKIKNLIKFNQFKEAFFIIRNNFLKLTDYIKSLADTFSYMVFTIHLFDYISQNLALNLVPLIEVTTRAMFCHPAQDKQHLHQNFITKYPYWLKCAQFDYIFLMLISRIASIHNWIMDCTNH